MNRVRQLINAAYADMAGVFGEGVCVAVLDTGERVIIMSS